MRIHVKLQLTFEDRAPGGRSPFELELVAGTTVARALEALSIPASTPKVIMVNGRAAFAEHVLAAGDELIVFPPIEGG